MSNLTYEAFASAVRRVAAENGEDLSRLGRSHVAHWVAGSRPRGRVPLFIAEVVSRRIGRRVAAEEIGFRAGPGASGDDVGLGWSPTVADSLASLGRADVERRDFHRLALYSLAAASMPPARSAEIIDRGRRASVSGAAIGQGDIDAVREMIRLFRSADERFGGGHARLALVQYLRSDVTAYLSGRFRSEEDRQTLFSAAAELAFLAGWKAFDASLHGLAQRYYLQAAGLAVEAGDRPLTGYVLRAMAHQAVDLGHGDACVSLAEAALSESAYQATPGATALFTVLRARGLGAAGSSAATATVLALAERLLSQAREDNEPEWMRFMDFGQASLASQAGQALRDAGDYSAAETQFAMSIALRDTSAHPRIHGLTLANLADVQARQGKLDQGCDNWNSSLDYLSGMQSGRARASIANIRQRLRSFGPHLPAVGKLVVIRATDELRRQAGRPLA
jgi:hypothetical protein